MTILNRIASNWSFQEREKLNNNWAIIEGYLSNLQGQINILTGEVNVQDIVDQINNLLNQGNIIVEDLNTALQDATTVITNAQNATTEASNAAQDALNAINDMQAFINQLGNAESYDNTKLYKVNNLVEYNGSGFICIKDTQGNLPPTLPTKRNEWWQLFAQRGLDGTGAVSKVAGKSPEADGNVPLVPEDIGAASEVNLNQLQIKVDEHYLDNLQRVINVKFPPSPLIAAVGNGIVNDQPTIQAIINYVSTNGGGTVFLPKGIYNVESSIMMKKGVSLKGVNGRFSTRLKWAKSTSGYIIDIRNVDLALCTIEDISFETVNTTRVGSGIIGGSTFANYNATSIRFKNLLFFGLDVGIHGKGVSESSDSRAIGIFDSYFENIWCSDCNAGMWLGGSGNVLINPRLSGCSTGIVMDFASFDSSTGIQVFGGVFANNTNYDLSVSDQRGIRNSIFVGTWFEDATSGIINVPNTNTTVRTLSFVNCQLQSRATQYGLMNFYNALGLIKIDSCTITQTLQDQDTTLIPPTDNIKGKLIVRDCVKYDYTGAQTFLNQ
ncbi:hypothetical protein [Bacillus phage SDFMU_Pfc]|nr:hypothetical protein [Bacillus phage SDFMU_Pfc]